MARLFSRTRATAVDDPEFGHFEADEQDGFDFPDDLSDRLGRFGHRGKPAWETEEERSARLHTEDSERRRDPATLYEAVEQIATLTKLLADMQIQARQAPTPPADPDTATTGADPAATEADGTADGIVVKAPRTRKTAATDQG